MSYMYVPMYLVWFGLLIFQGPTCSPVPPNYLTGSFGSVRLPHGYIHAPSLGGTYLPFRGYSPPSCGVDLQSMVLP